MYRSKLKLFKNAKENEEFVVCSDNYTTTIEICRALNEGLIDESEFKFTKMPLFPLMSLNSLVIYKEH